MQVGMAGRKERNGCLDVGGETGGQEQIRMTGIKTTWINFVDGKMMN